MAKKKSSTKKTSKAPKQDKKLKSAYDEDESGEKYNNELSEILSSNKEKIFTFGGIVGVILVLLIVFFSGCQFDKEAVIPDELDESNENAQIIDESGDEIIESVERESPDDLENLDGVQSTDLDQDMNPKPVEPIEFKSGIVESFNLRPTCNKGLHVYEVYTKFSQLPSKVTYQLKKSSENSYTDLQEMNGEFEKYKYMYICDGCPVGDEFSVLEGDEYDIRLKIDLFGELSYSDVISFSTKEDSEVMTKICSSADMMECDDTEYEKNPRARGLIKLGGEEYVEFCETQTSTEEYWCEDGEVKKEIIECEVKCWLGRCVG
jgi:hypothetical protein